MCVQWKCFLMFVGRQDDSKLLFPSNLLPVALVVDTKYCIMTQIPFCHSLPLCPSVRTWILMVRRGWFQMFFNDWQRNFVLKHSEYGGLCGDNLSSSKAWWDCQEWEKEKQNRGQIYLISLIWDYGVNEVNKVCILHCRKLKDAHKLNKDKQTWNRVLSEANFW